MNPTIQKLSLCSLVCLLAAGCHSSSSTPAPAAQVAVAAPQPAPAPPAAPKKLVCTGKFHDTSGGADFVEQSALYVLMNSKLGGWSSCTGKILSKTDDEQLVTFAGGSTLTLSSYPSSDASAQEAVLTGATAITREDVIKAFKQDQPADGCGVDWSQLTAGGPAATGDFKVSGTTCTTDLHIKMQNGKVVGFGFSFAA
jgi:hypothetical protein